MWDVILYQHDRRTWKRYTSFWKLKEDILDIDAALTAGTKPPGTVHTSAIHQCSAAKPGSSAVSAGCGRVPRFKGPRSRYLRSLQYKWGTGMCLRKKWLDINQRLIIIFMPCPKNNYFFSFQNATSSVLLAVLSDYFLLKEGCAAERSHSETNVVSTWHPRGPSSVLR